MIKVPFKSNNAFNSTMMASFLPVNTLVFIILAVIEILSKKNKQTENNRPRPRPIPKVTLKVINQDRMIFADFSVNCQLIFMKICNNHISTES